MQLYNLDTKITNKSYEILNCHIEDQKELDVERINEIRTKCRNILEKNGIFEDRRNGDIYVAMNSELKKLEQNIHYFNELKMEEVTKSKIEKGIDNVSVKIECLEQNNEYYNEEYNLQINRAHSENNIRSMLFNFFENYKANTVDMLLKRGYSQNTIDNIEEDILEYVTSKNSDILTEKFTQDGIKSMTSLNESLNALSSNILDEAEARYNCEVSGMIYDELKEKRDIIRQKAQKIQELMYQINSLDVKTNELKGLV